MFNVKRVDLPVDSSEPAEGPTRYFQIVAKIETNENLL